MHVWVQPYCTVCTTPSLLDVAAKRHLSAFPPFHLAIAHNPAISLCCLVAQDELEIVINKIP